MNVRNIVYDFEVFKYFWMVIAYDCTDKKLFVIKNNTAELEELHKEYRDDIWIGYNNKYYDAIIFKGIMLGLNPYDISNKIINGEERYFLPKNDIQMYNFDLSNRIRGLKELEGFMGSSIVETSVSFDLDRPLTEEEINEVVSYCKHDVSETVKVFENMKVELDSHALMIEAFDLPMDKFDNTKAMLSAYILEAVKPKESRNDEFKITIPDTLRLDKYKFILDWYTDPSNMNYKKKLVCHVSNVPHVFAFGGIHGAIPSYVGEGKFIMSDIASMYPATMINYGFLSRNIKNPKKYEEIRDRRMILKKEKNPLQLPLKIVLNSKYGCLKNKNSELFDPLMSNNVCITGQLLLLDLIEKVEPYCELIQSNTDGILVKIENEENERKYYEECDKWCKRSLYDLEHEEYTKIIQKDVNNYIIVEQSGKYKSKGSYVKKLSPIDNDLPIVNKALIDYFIYSIPVEKTILECDDFMSFQKIVKLTGKYRVATHNGKVLGERVFRVFASNKDDDGSISKIKGEDRVEKIANTPDRCFIYNEEVLNKKCPTNLDKQYYVELANDRIHKFLNNTFSYSISSGIKGISYKALSECEELMQKCNTFNDFVEAAKNISSDAMIVLIKLHKFEKYGSIMKLLSMVDYRSKFKNKTFKINSIEDDTMVYDILKKGEQIENEFYENKYSVDKTDYIEKDGVVIYKESRNKYYLTEICARAIITNKYCEVTNSVYKNIDKLFLFEKLWNKLEDGDVTVKDSVLHQLKHLDYIDNIPKGYAVGKVDYISSKNNSAKLTSYRNGKEQWFKFKKGEAKLPSKDDILLISDMYSKEWNGGKNWYIKKYIKLNKS